MGQAREAMTWHDMARGHPVVWAYRLSSTARVSLRKYFIPGCVGRGLDLDLRIRPAAAPAAASGPKWVGPSWAHVGGPKLGASGGAQAGPTWVGPSWAQVGGPKLGPSGWAPFKAGD